MTKLPSFTVMAVASASRCASTSTATCTRARGSPRSTLTTLPRISAASRKEAEKRIEDTTRMTAARRSRIYALELAKLGATAKHYPQERREAGKLQDSGDQNLRLHYFSDTAVTSTPAPFSISLSVY